MKWGRIDFLRELKAFDGKTNMNSTFPSTNLKISLKAQWYTFLSGSEVLNKKVSFCCSGNGKYTKSKNSTGIEATYPALFYWTE